MDHGYSADFLSQIDIADGSKLGVRLGRLCIANGVTIRTAAKRLSALPDDVYLWFLGIEEPSTRAIELVKDYIFALEDATTRQPEFSFDIGLSDGSKRGPAEAKALSVQPATGNSKPRVAAIDDCLQRLSGIPTLAQLLPQLGTMEAFCDLDEAVRFGVLQELTELAHKERSLIEQAIAVLSAVMLTSNPQRMQQASALPILPIDGPTELFQAEFSLAVNGEASVYAAGPFAEVRQILESAHYRVWGGGYGLLKTAASSAFRNFGAGWALDEPMTDKDRIIQEALRKILWDAAPENYSNKSVLWRRFKDYTLELT
jgi:hypothetical protein